MEKFEELESSAQEATILSLVGGLLKTYIMGDDKDLVENIPTSILKDLEMLQFNHHTQVPDTPLTPSARDRILERVSKELEIHCILQTRNTEYSDFHSISFDQVNWIRVLGNIDPQKFLKNEVELPKDEVGK